MTRKHSSGETTSEDFTKAAAQYEQLANLLRAQIISLETDRPVRLTAERQLCQIHQVSRETIRSALKLLEAEGLIDRAHGRSTMTNPGGIRAWRKLHHARVISVITPRRSELIAPGSFHGNIVQGIMDAAETAGYSVRLRGQGGPFPRMRAHIEPEDPAVILGAVLAGIYDDRLVKMHAQAGYPVVLVDYYSPDPRVDAVVVDCFGEGQRAAEFLLTLGHYRMFYVGGLHGSSSGGMREADADLVLTGFARTLRNAGLEMPAEHIFFCSNLEGDVGKLVQQVAGLQPRPTAGLVFDSGTFRSFIRQLEQVGLGCPQDLSLISRAQGSASLEAASLHSDPQMMGQMAVQLLLERASGRRDRTVCLTVRSTLHRGPSARSLT